MPPGRGRPRDLHALIRPGAGCFPPLLEEVGACILISIRNNFTIIWFHPASVSFQLLQNCVASLSKWKHQNLKIWKGESTKESWNESKLFFPVICMSPSWRKSGIDSHDTSRKRDFKRTSGTLLLRKLLATPVHAPSKHCPSVILGKVAVSHTKNVLLLFSTWH